MPAKICTCSLGRGMGIASWGFSVSDNQII
jgi:hypothetical protein